MGASDRTAAVREGLPPYRVDTDTAVGAADRGRVRVLTLANPSKRNALDDRTRRALIAGLDRAAAESDVRAIVLTGAGGSFCAGGDLASMPTKDTAAINARLSEMHRVIRTLISAPIPIVAAVEGFAFGSGLSLVAACDVVVAAEDAQFGAPFGRVGLAADCGLLWTLPRRVGIGRARTLVLTSSSWPAHVAAEIGLVDQVVAAGTALDSATQTAADLAAGAPLAIAATKRLLSDADGLEAFLDEERREQRDLLRSDDFSEGRAAFFERRSPRFQGI